MDYKNPKSVRRNQISIVTEYICDEEVNFSKSGLMDKLSGAIKIQ